MRCNAPNCSNESSKSTKGEGITFHPFPTDNIILNAWLKSLRLSSYEPLEDNIICSEHFNESDIIISKHGSRKLHHDAVPVDLEPEAPVSSKVCRICLVMGSKMKNLKKYHKLFKEVTGVLLDDEDGRLPQRICWECEARLTAAANFRDKALLSDGMLKKLLPRESHLKFSDVKSIKQVISECGFNSKLKQVTFDVQHFDLNIRDTFVDTKQIIKIEHDYLDNHLNEIEENLFIKNEIEDDGTESTSNKVDKKTTFTNNEIDEDNERKFEIEIEDICMDEYPKTFNFDEIIITNIETKNSETGVMFNETRDTDKVRNKSEIVIDISEVDRPAQRQLKNNDSNKEILSLNIDKDVHTTEVSNKGKRKKVTVNHKSGQNILKKVRTENDVYKYLTPIKKGGVTVFNVNSSTEIPEEFSPLKSHFTITPLTQEQVLKEIQERKEKPAYLAAPYKCKVCYEAFAVKERYDTHMMHHDKKNGPYQCGICLLFKPKACHLRRHMNIHSFEFGCKQCSWVSRHSQVARQHVKFHEGSSSSTCPHCSKTFNHHTTYLSHLRLKHMSHTVCELCGFTFINKVGVKQHKTKAHAHLLQNPPSFEGPHCDVCDVTFLSRKAYDTHLGCSSKHLSSETDPSRIRNDRGYQFGLPSRIVLKNGTRKCQVCKEKFDTTREYNEHFLRVHPELKVTPTKKKARKTYMCDQCGLSFISQKLMESHQWMHTGQKLFECHYCGKAFSQKINMTRHIESIHTDTKPRWSCEICEKPFKFQSNLARHLKQCHTSIRPWKCGFCKSSYLYPSELKIHVDFVHNKKPYPKRNRTREKAARKTEKLD